MKLEALKIDIAKQLFSVTEASVLEQIKSILEKKSIVAYAADGKPLNLMDYNKALEKAEQDILKGNVTNTKKLKQELKSWKK